MKLSEILCSDSIIVPLKAVKRDDVIKELVDALSSNNHLGKVCKDEIAKAIIKRENDASTGIGKGVAVPHVKHNVVSNAVVAIGVSEKGIDFSSLDKQPVFTVMLLVSSAKDTDKHLQAMEQIFKLLQSDKSRKFLRQSTTVEQIKEVITDFEEGRI
jgi:mannitol/fructose-specific phosphotransferase system IIA component (Ntr-type)